MIKKRFDNGNITISMHVYDLEYTGEIEDVIFPNGWDGEMGRQQ